MAKQHQDILDKLDPVGINRYNITAADIEMVDKYLSIIQKGYPGGSTWQEIVQHPTVYATSVVIHEIVEIRTLEKKGFKPLQYKTQTLRDLVNANIEIHALAAYEEHLYLQDAIARSFRQTFQIATLIRANRGNDDDLEYFLESDFGVFFLEEEGIEKAEQIIARLKGEQIMRLRKLQRLDEDKVWFDDAYAYENNEGKTIFRYSILTWGRVGARYSNQVRDSNTQLETIETVIPEGDQMRWLPIEVIQPDQSEAYLETLNQACAIPKPGKVSIAKAVAA